MTLRLLHDRVAIRRDDTETVSAGGIALPGQAAEKANRGTVVAVGPGITRPNGTFCATVVEVGDIVVFGPYAGSSTVKVDGESLLLLSENEILAVVDE
jgi:chaperonin GroES